MRTCVRALRRAPRAHRLLLSGRRVLAAELAAAAVEQGHSAMAVVDHNGVSGSMEFAMAAKPLGLRAIHGVEMDLHRTAGTVTLLVENGAGVAEPVPDRHAGASGRSAEARAAAGGAAGDAGGVLGRASCCLSGCADHGVHDEPTLRRLLAAFGPDHLRVELQRPFQRHDRSRNRELALAGGAAGGADGGDGQRPRPRALARAVAGRVRGAAPSPDAGRVGAGAARQHRARAVDADGRWRRASRVMRRRWRSRGSWRRG